MKFIISGDGNSIINLDKVKSIFYGTEKRSIMASVENASNIPILTEIESHTEGKTAMLMIGERLAMRDVIYAPTKEEIKAKIEQNAAKYRHINGKKTRGHGGS